MTLISVSPKARSIQYSCNHCGKKISASAGTPEAKATKKLFDNLVEYVKAYNLITPKEAIKTNCIFRTPPTPLPYERTTREPIPESVRTEVWRRDNGKCVLCGTNQNLEFDHIIPVSKGGATSVRNLQLLCQHCNAEKSARI